MISIHDINDAVGLGRLIANALNDIPPSVGLSIVIYPDELTSNHLRIINTGPTTIHGFHLYVHSSPESAPSEINSLSRIAKDVFGKPVIYRIQVPEAGIYLRPDNPLYVPLSELPNALSEQELLVKFAYTSVDGKRHLSEVQPLVLVSASRME